MTGTGLLLLSLLIMFPGYSFAQKIAAEPISVGVNKTEDASPPNGAHFFSLGREHLKKAMEERELAAAQKAYSFFTKAFLQKEGSGFEVAKARFWIDSLSLDPDLSKEERPFLLDHGQKTKSVVLLVHSFAAGPWEVRELGERIHKLGYNVYGMLIGNGRNTPQSTWKYWYNSLENAYIISRYIGEKTIVVGLSTSGGLCVKLCSDHSEIAAFVSVASAIHFKDKRMWPLNLTRMFSGSGRKKDHSFAHRMRSPAIQEVYKLADIATTLLSRLKQPVLILHSNEDEIIDVRSAETIFNSVASNHKRIVLFDGAPHFLLSRKYKGRFRVMGEIEDFVKGISEKEPRAANISYSKH